uniref:Thymic stromal cotransporter homolog n=1 Tax=Cacopsylla melanoneura TaxID=428564 RepID=A0A8D8M170_9HEMI
MKSIAVQNLNLEKACLVNLNYSQEVCRMIMKGQNISQYREAQKEGQELVAGMQIWNNFLLYFFPCVLLLFMGSYSDRHNCRKPFMLLPILGNIFMIIGLLISTYYFKEVSLNYVGLIEAIFPAITGSWIVFYMAVYTYISSRTTLKQRTFRIGLVSLANSVATPVGSAIAGVIVRECGYYGTFSFVGITYVLCFVYGYITIDELPVTNKQNCSDDALNNYSSEKVKPSQLNSNMVLVENAAGKGDVGADMYIQKIDTTIDLENNNTKVSSNGLPSGKVVTVKESSEDGLCDRFSTFLGDFFNCENIKGTFRSLFHDSQFGNTPNRNVTIILMMISVIVIFGPISGEFAIIYLYTRFRFNWNEIDYSIFSTVNTFTHLFGTMFSVVIFTKWFKVDDTIVGVISVCSKIISGLIYAFASSPTIFYVGPFAALFSGTSFIAMRSIISKLTSAEELGKVMSAFMLFEAIAPMIYNPMYSALYKATLDIMPSCFFLLGEFLTLPAIFMFLWIYREDKKLKKAALSRDGAGGATSQKQGIDNPEFVQSTLDLGEGFKDR